jgi:hypothetical protein
MAQQYPYPVEERRWRRPHSIFWPIFLIGVGVALLLDTMNLVSWNTWEMLVRLWPLLFIAGSLDSLYRGENYVGPVVTIGFGVLILLANLGYFPADSWTLVVRFWPVLIIAWGLDLVIGHRSVASALLGAAAGLALTGLIGWMAVTNFVTGSANGRIESVAQEAGEAEEADVQIEMIASDAKIGGGAEAGQLLQGEVGLARQDRLDSEYSVRNGRGNYRLKQDNFTYVFPFGVSAQRRWDLKLTDEMPVNLDTTMILGSQTIDLDQLQLKSLKMETVMGRNTILLPEAFPVGDVSMVMGELVILVEEGADVVIDADTAMTAVSLPEGYRRINGRILSPSANIETSTVDLQVSVPVGILTVKFK